LSAGPDWLSAGPDWLSDGPDWLSAGPDWLSDGPDWLSAGPDLLSAGPDLLSAGPDWLSAGPDLLRTVSGRDEVVQRVLQIGSVLGSVWASGQMSLWGSQCLAFSLNGHVVVVALKHSRNDQSRVFVLLIGHEINMIICKST
jgi:hypothetical protein